MGTFPYRWTPEKAKEARLKRKAQQTPPALDLSRDAAMMQAAALQRLLVKDAENPETTPTARAQVARAWKELQEQRRILMGIPLPKPIEVKVDPAPSRILHSEDSPDSPQMRSSA